MVVLTSGILGIPLFVLTVVNGFFAWYNGGIICVKYFVFLCLMSESKVDLEKILAAYIADSDRRRCDSLFHQLDKVG
jgi:hypothetical protein